MASAPPPVDPPDADFPPDWPKVKPVEALRFFRAKGFTFGFSWQDVWQDEHDRAFTVAKAMTRDLLEDIRAAMDRAIDEGQTAAMFAKELRPILQAKGWWGRKWAIDPETGEQRVVQLGSPSRLRTIYRTNMRTAQAAGRWERIDRNKKAFPFLEYSSVMDGREREEHHAWDGTILPVDDPWWDTHFPPCGWNCRCTVKARNQRMMDAKGLKLTTSPRVFPAREWVNKRTGEIHSIKRGIDPGWAYHPGKSALDGVTPAPIAPGAGSIDVTASAVWASRLGLSRGATAALAGFFGAFEMASVAQASRGKIIRDAEGWPMAISLRLFRDAAGRIVPPSEKRLKGLSAVAQTLLKPESIRWQWVRGDNGRMLLMRRYVSDGAIVDVGGEGWRFAVR